MCQSRREALVALGGACGTVLFGGCLGSREAVETVESMPAPALGDPEAPVTVAAYTDFACPHCHRWALEAFPPIRDRYVGDGTARYEHHDFPIPVDERWSWDAAEAGRSVQDRADADRFFAFARTLYRQGGTISEDAVRSAAENVGVDGDAVLSDAEADVYRAVVESDRQAARDRGVEATPAVFVDGRQVQPTTEAVEAAIERSTDSTSTETS